MYERDEFLRDRIRPHQPGTPRGYSPRPPSGDRCPAPPPGRHAAAATPPGPPRLPSAPLRPLPDPAWPRQPEAPPPSTWADPALAPIRSRTRPGERGWRRMVAAGHLWPCRPGPVGHAAPGGPIRSNDTNRPAWQPQGRRAGQRRCGKDVGCGVRRIDPCRTAPAGPYRRDRRRHRLRQAEQPNRSSSSWFVLGADHRHESAVLHRYHRAPGPKFRGTVRPGRPAGIRSAPGARSGHLPRSRPKVGSPFRNLGDRLRFLHGGGGHPGGIARCGCSDRGVLALGGWCLRCRQHHRMAVGLWPDRFVATQHRGAQRFGRTRRQAHQVIAGPGIHRPRAPSPQQTPTRPPDSGLPTARRP